MRSLFVCSMLVALAVVASGATPASDSLWAQNAQRGGGRANEPIAGPPHDPRDLTGVWNMRGAGGAIFGGFAANPKLTPYGEELFKKAKASTGGAYTLQEMNDPVLSKCLPPGVPRVYLHPFPWQIVQTPKETLFLYEYDHTVRRIFTDGRKHPEDVTPTYMGHSVGHWEGDTFVVDTVGFFNERSWLDRIGHGHSDRLHVIERIRRANLNALQLEVTMEDPKTLAEPWKVNLVSELRPNWSIQELNCADNAEFLDFVK